MNARESDPNGASTRGGATGLEDGAEPEGSARAAEPGAPGNAAEHTTPGVDETERAVVTSGIAQTSEVADRGAQDAAEAQGDGPPLPR